MISTFAPLVPAGMPVREAPSAIPDHCHGEFTPAVSRPALDETSPYRPSPYRTVMAGLVPAIRSGRVLRPMAGTSPAMTMKGMEIASLR